MGLINDLFYWVGACVCTLISAGVALYIIGVIWTYFSIGVFYWWVHVTAVSRYPNCDAVNPEFTSQPFWRTRLLVHILGKPKAIFNKANTQLYGQYFELDFSGRLPTVTWKGAHIDQRWQ